MSHSFFAGIESGRPPPKMAAFFSFLSFKSLSPGPGESFGYAHQKDWIEICRL